jgi:zinc/manganese transport system ATP-binding protein
VTTLGYDRHPAVHHLDGDFEKGSLTAIAGPNGAGKSTLLKGIIGALNPLQGHIHRHIAASQIAYLPQAADINRAFPINVADFIGMGLWRRQGMGRGLTSFDKSQVEQALHTVGLDGFAKRAIGSLSGGQMQRILFARLLMQDAQLILLDEPFSAIDTKTIRDLMTLVMQWHGEKRTIIAVLHDHTLISEMFPQTLLLAREKIAWGATREILSAENLARARHMVEAFDPSAPECHRHDEHHPHAHQ